jgi:predicted Zn-dependent protease
MLDQRQTEDLLHDILHLSQADETEVLILAHNSALTRFANNHIHQNVAEHDVTVTVRAVVGKRIGSASTNNLSTPALARVVEEALAHARQHPEDPDFSGLSQPQPVAPILACDEDTAHYSPAAQATAVGVVCSLAASQQLWAAGAFRTGLNTIGLANSHGLLAYHTGTLADLQIVVMGADGSGWAHGSSWQAHCVDAEALGREAVAKAIQAQHPRPIQPGAYTIVVDPYVTHELLTTLSFCGMGARSVQEGRSWMNDRIGKQEMSNLVSIWDDGRNAPADAQPFDREGMPKRRVQIVENGVICEPVHDRSTAAREGRETTGHATFLGELAASEPLAAHLFMAPGDSSLEEMIASTTKGLYITRFWYPRLVHPRNCVITAMTRDGVFMIEDGELTYPVKNLRFTQSYVEAMAGVQAVGRDMKTLVQDVGGTSCVPALKIERFTFTGSTA